MTVSVGDLVDYSSNHLSEDPEDELIIDLGISWANTVKDEVAWWGQWKFLQGWDTINVPRSGIVYFPDHVWQVTSLFPSQFGYRRPVQMIGPNQFDEAGPGASAGLSDYSIEWGYYGVQIDNPTAGPITFESDQAGGDQNLELVAEGKRASDRAEVSEKVSLDGAGQATSAVSFVEGVEGVRNVYVVRSSKEGKALGNVTVKSSSSDTLVVIPTSTHLGKEFIRTELYPTTSGPGFVFRYFRRIADAVDLDSVFPFPREFKNIMFHGLRWLISDWEGSLGASAAYYQQMIEDIARMKYNQERQPGRRRGIVPNQSYRFRRWRW